MIKNTFKNAFLIATILSLTSVQTQRMVDYDIGSYQGRPIPPELAYLLDNVTKSDDNMQDCMKEFVECMGIHSKQNFCAVNKAGERKKFERICDLIYENCKGDEEVWHYYLDDHC